MPEPSLLPQPRPPCARPSVRPFVFSTARSPVFSSPTSFVLVGRLPIKAKRTQQASEPSLPPSRVPVHPPAPIPLVWRPLTKTGREDTAVGALSHTPPPRPTRLPTRLPLLHAYSCSTPFVGRLLRSPVTTCGKREEQTQSPTSVAPPVERGVGLSFEDAPQRDPRPVRFALAHRRGEAEIVSMGCMSCRQIHARFVLVLYIHKYRVFSFRFSFSG